MLGELFSRNIEVVLQLDPDIPPITADLNQLTQVFLNLCLNARDAMPEGGKLVIRTQCISGAELRGCFIEVNEKRYVSIAMSDTGSGMSETIRTRVFEPFFTTKSPGQGTGLGLSVAHGIIVNHRGIIDVESEPGRGSTFHVYLPIPDVSSPPLQTSIQPGEKNPELALKNKTILFVEDELRQLHLIQQFLQGQGYRVLAAAGAEAVELFLKNKHEIALAVIDLQLPNLNGWEALQIMRKSKPELKAIIASGHLPPHVELEATKGGLNGLLSKPYQLDEILGRISSALQTPR
jgi:CheY-like chemotaxis protein